MDFDFHDFVLFHWNTVDLMPLSQVPMTFDVISSSNVYLSIPVISDVEYQYFLCFILNVVFFCHTDEHLQQITSLLLLFMLQFVCYHMATVRVTNYSVRHRNIFWQTRSALYLLMPWLLVYCRPSPGMKLTKSDMLTVVLNSLRPDDIYES